MSETILTAVIYIYKWPDVNNMVIDSQFGINSGHGTTGAICALRILIVKGPSNKWKLINNHFAKHKKWICFNVSIKLFIELLKINISNAFSMKDHGKESNASSKSTNTKRPGILCASVHYIISYANLVFSLMYLPFL